MVTMRHIPALLVAVACLGCEAVGPQVDDLPLSPAFAMGPIVHQATLGGADVCEALGLPTGCDANFSLVANQYADGSVAGQWQDSFRTVEGQIHVAVDCLAVHGNQAVVGGVITHATGAADGSVGQRAITSVKDNGTSANDPPDQLSFSFFPVGVDCTIDPAVFPFVNLTNGQVRVW